MLDFLSASKRQGLEAESTKGGKGHHAQLVICLVQGGSRLQAWLLDWMWQKVVSKRGS